jgi:hypothetical protein
MKLSKTLSSRVKQIPFEFIPAEWRSPISFFIPEFWVCKVNIEGAKRKNTVTYLVVYAIISKREEIFRISLP